METPQIGQFWSYDNEAEVVRVCPAPEIGPDGQPLDERYFSGTYVKSIEPRNIGRTAVLVREMWSRMTAAQPQQATLPASEPDDEAVRAGFRAYDGRGSAGNQTRWQVWRDAVAWAARAQPAPQALGADPDGVRYRHLRACNSGSMVIVKMTGPGDEDYIIVTEDSADAEVDAEIARMAAAATTGGQSS